MSTDDDREQLLHALQAPGSEAELSEEERYRAMFREANAPVAPVTRLRSRTPHRLLVGGVTATVLAVGVGGVAAAYSGQLPDPIQTFAHHVIGAPEASPATPRAVRPAPRARTPRQSSAPRPTASKSPSQGPTTPQPSRRPRPTSTSSPAPAQAPAKPSAAPSPQESPTPTPTPTPVLTGVTASGTSHQADVGARMPFTGQLSYADATRPHERVVLQRRTGSGWVPVARGRAAFDGSFTLTAPPLERTSGFRVRAGEGTGAVLSTPWRVAMHPLISAGTSTQKRTATIRLTAVGGDGGDVVTLVTQRDGKAVVVDRARLDGSGSASFVVTPDRRRTTYAVVLGATQRHTASRTKVVVVLGRGG